MMNSYPMFFKDFDAENIEVQINLWQRSLADCEYRDVVNAFEIWLNTEKYPPTLAEFKPVVIRFKNPKRIYFARKSLGDCYDRSSEVWFVQFGTCF